MPCRTIPFCAFGRRDEEAGLYSHLINKEKDIPISHIELPVPYPDLSAVQRKAPGLPAVDQNREKRGLVHRRKTAAARILGGVVLFDFFQRFPELEHRRSLMLTGISFRHCRHEPEANHI